MNLLKENKPVCFLILLFIVLSSCQEEKIKKDVTKVKGEGTYVDVKFNEDVVLTDSTEMDIDVVGVDSTTYERKVYNLSVDGDQSIIKKGNVIVDTSKVGKSRIWIIVEGGSNKKGSSVGKAIEGGLDCIFGEADITVTTKSNRAKKASTYPGKIPSKNEYDINYKGWEVLEDIGLLEGTNPKWINEELSISIDKEKTLYNEKGAKVAIKSGNINIDPSVDLQMNFRPGESAFPINPMGATVALASIKKLHCTVYSDVDLNLKADVDFEGEVPLIEESIKLGRFYFNVPIGMVDLSISMELIARLNIQADGSVEITPHFVSRNNFVSSMDYGGAFEKPTFYSEDTCIEKNLSRSIKGEIGLTQRLEVVPRVEVYIYGVTGASSELIPYEEFTINAAASGNWDSRLVVGVDGEVGADISAFHTDLITAQMYSHDFNIKKWPLYSSPDSIEIISGNNQSANTGQTLPNDIVVEAVDSKDSPISNVPVYFKTAGNCGSVDNSKVVTGSKGKASVSWKLGSKTGKQTLYAYLKKADGNIIRHSKININATADGNTNSNMVKWKFNAESSISTSPAIGHNGTIYAGADNGYLYAVNETGSQIWKFKTDNSIHSSPTVDKNGNIYVGSDDGFLYAINSDGSLRWRYEVGNKIRSSPGIGYNGTIYFGANDGYLYALTSDGKLKWKFETEHKFDENLERVEWKVESSPAIGMDGTIYIGSIYVGHDYWLGLMYYSYLYAINPDGSQKWRYKTESNINNAPSIGPNGKVYVSGGPLYAINSDGTLRWKYSSKYNFNSSLSIDSYGRIYGGSGEFIIEDSYFHLYAIHPDGSRKWKFELTENIATTPVLGADGTLYFGGDDKYIYAVNADGTQKWRHKTGGKIQSSPVMDTKGTIYFGSDDGYLYAIQVGTRQAETPWPMFQNDPQNSGRKNR